MAFDVVFLQDFVRQEALQMLQNALDGSGGLGASAAYSEAFRIVMRLGVGDKSFIVRIAAARCLMTFATIGGPGLGVTEIENSATYCVKVRVPPQKKLCNFKHSFHLEFYLEIFNLALLLWCVLITIKLIRLLKMLFHLSGMPLLKHWVPCLHLE